MGIKTLSETSTNPYGIAEAKLGEMYHLLDRIAGVTSEIKTLSDNLETISIVEGVTTELQTIVPMLDTITSAAGSAITFESEYFTSTLGQQDFTLSHPVVSPHAIILWVNDVKMTPVVDFDVDGDTLSLVEGLDAGIKVELIYFNGVSMEDILLLKEAAEESAETSRKWASLGDNQQVDTVMYPGKFSAKHYANFTEVAKNRAEEILAAIDLGALDSAVALTTAARITTESARDAALMGVSNIYETEAEGLADTVDGEYFSVTNFREKASITLIKNISGSGTEITSYPSIAHIDKVLSETYELYLNVASYVGEGVDNIVPVIVDSENKILFGVDKLTGELFGKGIDNILGETATAAVEVTGLGYTPLVIDADYRVILGFNNRGLIGKIDSSTDTSEETSLTWADYNGIIFYGQSLSVGAASGDIISVSQPYENVTFSGGPRAWANGDWSFGVLKPLVEDSNIAPDGGGNRGETPCSGTANYASTLLAKDGVLPSDHVIFASTAGHGGYSITLLEKGSVWYDNLIQHIDGFVSSTQGSGHIHAMGWLQGENDIGGSMPYTTYYDKLSDLHDDFSEEVINRTGQSHAPALLTYQVSYKSRVWKDMALAQLDLSKNKENVTLVSPTYFVPHAVDRVHLTAFGYKLMGAYYGKAYKALVTNSKEVVSIVPKGATYSENQVVIHFDVPQGPLVIDQTWLAPTEDDGFYVSSDGIKIDITDITVGEDTVTLTLDSPILGDGVVRYALDYYAPTGYDIASVGTGNLRDSDPSKTNIGGTEVNLYNVSPAFELNVTKIGY